ncbi:MAG: MFS transporter, partial [Syntrophales bacterium]|nr:MFS transporter [Syntrophales bacterium]
MKRQRFYGWTTLIGVMFTYAGMCGDLTYAYGLFLPSMAETYQWSRSLLSGPYAAFIIVGGLLGPVAGMTIARFGARLNIMLSNILAAAGLLGMSQADSIWHVYFFFGLMGGIGIAFGEFIPVTTIINHWFVSKRSLAMGLLFASGGLGGLIMPPVISWIIITAGWRTAWVFLAGIHLVLSVLMCAVLVK